MPFDSILTVFVHEVPVLAHGCVFLVKVIVYILLKFYGIIV